MRQQCKIFLSLCISIYNAAVKCKQTSSAVRKWWNVLIHDVITFLDWSWLQSLTPDGESCLLCGILPTLPCNDDLFYFHSSLTVYDVTMFKIKKKHLPFKTDWYFCSMNVVFLMLDKHCRDKLIISFTGGPNKLYTGIYLCRRKFSIMIH